MGSNLTDFGPSIAKGSDRVQCLRQGVSDMAPMGSSPVIFVVFFVPVTGTKS